MNRWLVTGAGHSVCDAWIQALDDQFAEDTIVLVDGPDVAGEARRILGRTVVIQVASDVELTDFDGVIDLAGDAITAVPCLTLPTPTDALLGRLLRTVPSLTGLRGSIAEPAIAIPGGVEALAGQVSQLFNGRDPDPEPFGGTIAFNQRWLDRSVLAEMMAHARGLPSGAIALAVHQTDLFYTTQASLWVTTSADCLDRLESEATLVLTEGVSAAPGRGRAEDADSWQMGLRRLSATEAQLEIYADTEHGLWVPAMVTWMTAIRGGLQ